TGFHFSGSCSCAHLVAAAPICYGRGMELRHLEQIVAICRAGSFSGAAKQLGIAQPTLSKSIGRLEAKLGILLFERSNVNARPTIYGQFVADHAAALLQNVSTL